jgi:4,4'-diaponeurosporenoate glycosyltransferase
MARAYERLSSMFFIVMMASIRSFTLAGERLTSNGSFGPCIVCSREDYFGTGGHRLERAEIIDDVALAREMGRLGVATSNFIGRGVIRFRMYPGGLGDLVEGWTKNFARGAMTTGPGMLLLITAWIYGGMAAADTVLNGLLGVGDPHGLALGLVGYGAYVAQIWWLLRKLGNFGLATAMAYPLALLFFFSVFARSLYLTLVRNSVRWKDRSIPVRSTG